MVSVVSVVPTVQEESTNREPAIHDDGSSRNGEGGQTTEEHGWIWVKKTKDSQPRRIKNQLELMNYLEVVPLIRSESTESVANGWK